MSPSGLTPEQQARQTIDANLRAAGWLLQDRADADEHAGRGVAVREFKLEKGHGFADYLLFVDGRAVGGNNQPALNKSRVQGNPFPLPPLAEQHRIAAAIEDPLSVVDHAGADQTATRGRIARLRQSILKSAFEGRLIPNENGVQAATSGREPRC